MQAIAAVDIENGTGRKGIADEKAQRLRDFGGTSHPAHRNLAAHLLKKPLFLLPRHPVIHRRINQARRKNVDTDRRQLSGESERHRLNCAVDRRHAGSIGNGGTARSTDCESDGSVFAELRKGSLSTKKIAIKFMVECSS